MQRANQEIIESMNQSIFKGSYPVTEDILDLNFDELAKSDVIKHIPVLSVINALYKGALGIRDRFFMRKVVLFINQFNSGLSTPKIQKFVSNVLTDENFREKVNERILILLDRFEDEVKALILAELLKSWINRDIDWDTFQRFTYTVERAHPSVFPIVYDYYKNYEILSKTSAGVFNPYAPLIIGSGFGSYYGFPSHLGISKDALDLCEFGMKNLFDNQYENLPENIKIHLKIEAERKKEKLLGNPNFSGYEQWIVGEGSTPNSNFKIRKIILDKIRKYYPIH
jgi:hypothetical protein